MVEWTRIDPTTGIAVMLVFTGCCLVLFQDALKIDEIPEWFVGAFVMAVGFYLAAKTQQMRDEATARSEHDVQGPEVGTVRYMGDEWWTWNGEDWDRIPTEKGKE